MAPSTTATNPPALSSAPVGPKEAVPAKTTSTVQSKFIPQGGSQKKASRRSSKPIITWFQRKLAGTVKVKRADDGGQLSVGEARGPGSGSARVSNRIASSPIPSAHGGRQQGRLDTLAVARRKTISLNGDDTPDISTLSDDERSLSESVARESTWSPNSALEADEDASLRPLPPSSPPSPSPSRSSSSYLSDPRTFRSIAASTKPTTLLSIDLHGNGMAHIAQAPLTPTSQVARPTHAQTSSTSTVPNLVGSGASITFSALPPSPQPSSRSSIMTTPQLSGITSVQAPLHTTHHPRNNPRPSSPPMDNASVLTLASSAYAIPGLRVGSGTPGWSSAPPSAIGGGGDSVSQFGMPFADVDSTSQDDEEPLDERDADASLRALRPRSTRRGSWESEASRWSARIHVGTGTPSLARERSLWTANSIRTGAFSAENVDVYEKADDTTTTEGDSPAKEETQALETAKTQLELSEDVAPTQEASTQVSQSVNTLPGFSEDNAPAKDSFTQILKSANAEPGASKEAEAMSPEPATADSQSQDSHKKTLDVPTPAPIERQLSSDTVAQPTDVASNASTVSDGKQPAEVEKAEQPSESVEPVVEGVKDSSEEIKTVSPCTEP